ncbi:MAG TPA: PDZ domain-containing protein [Planctomycetaceae bacterium]|nr:PDZ domain-containing protein [Planctomycetaceae bacterium]
MSRERTTTIRRFQNTLTGSIRRLPIAMLGLWLLGGVALAQRPIGLPSPVESPPGAPAPQPHLPAGGSHFSPGEGLLVEPEPVRVTGKIVRVEDNRLTLKTNDTNDSLTYTIDATAEVVLNKEPAQLRDLRPGDFIRLTLTDGEAPQAELVWAARIKEQADQPDQTFPATVFDDFPPPRGRAARGQAGGLGVVVTNTPGAGVLIVGVRTGTPAAEVGLTSGDYILAVNNQRIMSGPQLINSIRSQQAGQAVALTVWTSRPGSVQSRAPGAAFVPGVVPGQTTIRGSVEGDQLNPQDGTGRRAFGETSSQFDTLPFESPESRVFGTDPFPTGAGQPQTIARQVTGPAGPSQQSRPAAAQDTSPAPAETGAQTAPDRQGRPVQPRQSQPSTDATPGDIEAPADRTRTTDAESLPADVTARPAAGNTFPQGAVGFPVTGTTGTQTTGTNRAQGPQTVRVVLTSAARAQDAVVDGLGHAPVGQSGFVNGGVGGLSPGMGVSTFAPLPGTTGAGTVTDQQVVQLVQQLRQDVQTLREEIFRLHGQAPPDAATTSQGLPPGTTPGAAPRTAAPRADSGPPQRDVTIPPAGAAAQTDTSGLTPDPAQQPGAQQRGAQRRQAAPQQPSPGPASAAPQPGAAAGASAGAGTSGAAGAGTGAASSRRIP